MTLGSVVSGVAFGLAIAAGLAIPNKAEATELVQSCTSTYCDVYACDEKSCVFLYRTLAPGMLA